MAIDPHNSFHLCSLRESLAPFRLHFFPSLRSTNDHAAAMRRRGELFAPAIVLTSRQTAGRGRGTHTWFSTRGSITATFVLPADPMLAAHHVPLAAGLAVRNAVAALTPAPDSIQLKWPNDLVVPGAAARAPLRKLAGLLCERLENIDLIGLGLNVNRCGRVPAELKQRLVCLEEIGDCTKQDDRQERGMRRPVGDVLAVVAREIHQVLMRKNQTPFGLLLREYDRHHALRGRLLAVHPPHETPVVGRCVGLDETGRLLLRVNRRTIPIVAGHVEVRQE